ncbi:hypothetical protein [Streptomyces sp. NPDC060187]|uniref:hypothetical protein n=1 Tax=Streptomyces sp. NPDC060187 TaxID=3347067 RepID=UPI0036563B81
MNAAAVTAIHTATEELTAPTEVQLALAITLGILLGITFGALHRTDSPAATPGTSYHLAEAIMRGGKAFLGVFVLTLASLLIPSGQVSLLILLVAAVVGVCFGFGAKVAGSTLRAAAWRAATTAASVAGVCHTVLALYQG